MTVQVVIYGASGYTGKLIAWHLAERGIPFIAAGRNLKRIEDEMSKIPELKDAEYECAEVEHDETALSKLFANKRVVYNVVGPFMQLGVPVVRAALNSGCNYIDTSGEQDWIRHLKHSYSTAFSDKGLLVVSGCSWMWLAGQLAAEVALESPGIDTLDICYLADTKPSVASTMSFLRMLTKDQFYLLNNELENWPSATHYPVSFPGMHQILNALPWSGGGEPIWYQDDPRVNNCNVLVAFRDRKMIQVIIDTLAEFEEKHKDLPVAEQEAITNAIGRSWVQDEPEREIPELHRSLLSCHGRGNTESVTVVIRGNGPYLQTGTFAALACETILLGKQHGVGFSSPAKAFGAREMLAAAAERGQLSWNITSV